MQTKERVRVKQIETLSDDWYILRKTTFDYLRNNGEWQTQTREAYDRGNGATILLYHPQQRTVVITRQFRYPAFVNGYNDLLIEAPAGLLDESSPEERIKAETEEETGYEVHDVRKIFEAYMSPGSVTEKLYFFVAEYDPASRVGAGDGVRTEGEDIEVHRFNQKALRNNSNNHNRHYYKKVIQRTVTRCYYLLSSVFLSSCLLL